MDSYTYTAGTSIVDGIDDRQDYSVMSTCLKDICQDEDLFLNIMQMLAGILHIGNVNFIGNAEEDQVSGVDDACRQHFDAAAELLGLDADDLFNTLTKQNMYVNNSVIVKVQNISQVRNLPFYAMMIESASSLTAFFRSGQRQEAIAVEEYLHHAVLLVGR